MAYDAAIKEKAKDLYVINSLNVRTISTILPEVPIGTLTTWCNDDKWVKQRKDRVAHTVRRREKIDRALDQALDSLNNKFDHKLVLSIDKLVAALKSTSTFEFTEELKQKPSNLKKGLSPENLKEIEEKLLGL
jgi:hypothetical protein